MKKRSLLKNIGATPLWTSPLISAVLIPSHAQATLKSTECDAPIIFDTPGQFELTVPACASSVTVEVAGASGGANENRFRREGGVGSLVNDSFTVNPGDSLTIFVGEAAEETRGSIFSLGGFGYGNGGNGGMPNTASANPQVGGSGGGGGSAVLLNGTPMSVAGGGGGTAGVATTNRGFGGNGGSRGDEPGGGEPGVNGVGGAGGQHQSQAGFGENGGPRDGGDGATVTSADFTPPEVNHGGGGGGGGYGGGGGGGLFAGGGGGGSLATNGSVTPGGAPRGNGRVVVTYQ